MRASPRIAVIAVAFAAFSTLSRAQNDAASQKEPAPPPSVTVIGARDAHGVLGRDVRSAADEGMGRIVDVIVDRGGQVRAAVMGGVGQVYCKRSFALVRKEGQS